MRTLTEIYKSLVKVADGVDTDGLWPQQLAWHEHVALPGQRVVVTTFPGAGKFVFAQACAIDALQHDPNQRVLVVTSSPPVARVMLHELARELGATPDGNGLTIERTKPIADPSLTVISAQHPPALLGNRFDLVVVDRSNDSFDLAELNRQWAWLNSSVFARMTLDSRAIVLEHNHDENDLAHRLLANGWLGSTWAADEPALAAWSKRRIDHERLRHDLGEEQYRRLYLCEPTWRTLAPQSEQVVGGIDASID